MRALLGRRWKTVALLSGKRLLLGGRDVNDAALRGGRREMASRVGDRWTTVTHTIIYNVFGK